MAVEKTNNNCAKLIFSFSEDEKLVENISNFPCLFDFANSLYKNHSVKENTWKKVAGYVERSVDDCKKRWRNIKDTYMKRKKSGKGGTGSAASKSKPWPLFKRLSFLGKVEHIRLSTSNIEGQESQDNVVNEDTTNSHQEFDVSQSTLKASDITPKRKLTLNITSQHGKTQKLTDNLTQMMEDRQKNRDQIIESIMNKKQEDEIDLFYESIALSVKKLRRDLQNEAKMQSLQMVIDLERRNDIPSVIIPLISSEFNTCNSFPYSSPFPNMPIQPPSIPHFPENIFNQYENL